MPPAKKSKVAEKAKSPGSPGKRRVTSLFESSRTMLSGPAQLIGGGRRSYAPIVMLTDDVLLQIKKNLSKKTATKSKTQVKRLSTSSKKSDVASKIPKPKKSLRGKGAAGKLSTVKGSPASDKETPSPKSEKKRGRKPAKVAEDIELSTIKGLPASVKETPSPKSEKKRGRKPAKVAEDREDIDKIKQTPAVKKKQQATPSPKTERRGRKSVEQSTHKKPSKKMSLSPSPRKSSEYSPSSPIYFLRSGRGSPPSEASTVPASTKKPVKSLRKSVEGFATSESQKRIKLSAAEAEPEASMTKIKSRRLTEIGTHKSEIETPLKVGGKRKLDDVETDDVLLLPKKRNLTTVLSEKARTSSKDVIDAAFTTPLEREKMFQSVLNSRSQTRKTTEFLKPLGTAIGVANDHAGMTASSTSSVTTATIVNAAENHTVRVQESVTTSTRRSSVGRGRANKDVVSNENNQLLNSIPRTTRRRKIEADAEIHSTASGNSVPATAPELTSEIQSSRRRSTCAKFCQCVMLLGIPAIVAVGVAIGIYNPDLIVALQNYTAPMTAA